MDYRSKFLKDKIEHIFEGQKSVLMLSLKKIVLNMNTHALKPKELDKKDKTSMKTKNIKSTFGVKSLKSISKKQSKK